MIYRDGRNKNDKMTTKLTISGYNGTSKVLAKSTQSKRGEKVCEICWTDKFYVTLKHNITLQFKIEMNLTCSTCCVFNIQVPKIFMYMYYSEKCKIIFTF